MSVENEIDSEQSHFLSWFKENVSHSYEIFNLRIESVAHDFFFLRSTREWIVKKRKRLKREDRKPRQLIFINLFDYELIFAPYSCEN